MTQKSEIPFCNITTTTTKVWRLKTDKLREDIYPNLENSLFAKRESLADDYVETTQKPLRDIVLPEPMACEKFGVR